MCVCVLVVVLMADTDQERVRLAHLLHKQQSEVFQAASSLQVMFSKTAQLYFEGFTVMHFKSAFWISYLPD